MANGRLVILSGPSGVGKDTIIDAWRQVNPRVRRVVAATTRDPRPGEEDGVDYHFLDKARFEEIAEKGGFLESKLVFGNYYATPLEGLEALLAEGNIAILKIDVQGAMTAMELRPEAESVFLLPPSDEELSQRLTGRGSDAPDVIARRLLGAKEEIAFSDRYRHRIVNDSVERVVAELERIVNG